MKVANAPCSWGTIENTAGARIGYRQMLDELVASGYAGTELGDLGFMPTDPEMLRDELAVRDLELVGSWVTVRLYDAAFHDEGVARAVEVARLLRAVGGPDAVVNVGDDHSTVPLRTRLAGRIRDEHALDEAGMDVVARGLTRVAEAVAAETGLRTGLHHHGATYVETPHEVERFMERTDPALVHLCFDTGHWMLGGGDPVSALERWFDRIQLVHAKDFDPAVRDRADAEGWGYPALIEHGIFPELGRGAVDFAAVMEVLRRRRYDGWIVVEQDVLPGLGTPKESATRNRAFLATLERDGA